MTLATGTEVALAVEAAGQLAEQGMKVAVVSLPCWELFEQRDGPRWKVLGLRQMGIEAASGLAGYKIYLGR